MFQEQTRGLHSHLRVQELDQQCDQLETVNSDAATWYESEHEQLSSHTTPAIINTSQHDISARAALMYSIKINIKNNQTGDTAATFDNSHCSNNQT